MSSLRRWSFSSTRTTTSFEAELYRGRALFGTLSDLAVLGLGSAGAVSGGENAKAILSAISAGVAGTRTSIDKNFFNELTTQVLTSKMQSARKRKLATMRKGMALEPVSYSLARGISDLGEYYTAGTLIGALVGIAADAGEEAKQADRETREVVEAAYAVAGPTRPLRNRINRWLNADLATNVPKLQSWLRRQSPPIRESAPTWVDDANTPEEELRRATEDPTLAIPE